MSPIIKLSEMVAFFHLPLNIARSPLFAMSFKRVNVDLWKINDMENSNKPAYPISEEMVFKTIDKGIPVYSGLTKREYFAGLAMQGLLANSNYNADFFWVSDRSIKYADELLKQLNETNE